MVLQRDAPGLLDGSEIRLAAERGYRAYDQGQSSSFAPEVDRREFRAAALPDAYLRRFLERALEAGVTVLMEAMPLPQTSRDSLKPEYAEKYQAYMEELAGTYTRARISPARGWRFTSPR